MIIDKYYDLIWKKFRKEPMADCVRIYWENGYTTWKDFPNEYFFMYNPLTGEKVRLYYNGAVREGDFSRK